MLCDEGEKEEKKKNQQINLKSRTKKDKLRTGAAGFWLIEKLRAVNEIAIHKLHSPITCSKGDCLIQGRGYD